MREIKNRKKWPIVLGTVLAVLVVAAVVCAIVVHRNTVKQDEVFVSESATTQTQEGESAVAVSVTDEMIEDAKTKFTMETYKDDETGLTVDYNIFIPENYDESQKYPLMVFIADSSSVGTDTSAPLTRNVGGAVWATTAEQEQHPSFVVVPNYPEVILDDHGSYTMTDYVELTARMIISIEDKYSIDEDRVYGTGQSMGAMTTMYLAANNPDLYAAVLLVDGQWNIDELQGLKNATFTYIAAGGDEKAYAGQTEVKELLDGAGITYGSLTDLDAQADVSELNEAADGMYAKGYSQNFITWKKGTMGTVMGGEHMASFPYGYKVDSVRAWVYAQHK